MFAIWNPNSKSYKVATENAKKTANRNKARFDKHVDSILKEGDRVLVRNVRLRGKHKLADRWESEVYVVLRQSGADTAKAAKRPRTWQYPKNDSSDEADGEESQSDPEEYPYDGYRNLRVETLGFDLTSETVENLLERIEPEPSKTLTAVEQDLSDVAKAFPEDAPVENCDLNWFWK